MFRTSAESFFPVYVNSGVRNYTRLHAQQEGSHASWQSLIAHDTPLGHWDWVSTVRVLVY